MELICAIPRSASKDPDLEQNYLRLLKETSAHEKAINRDLGRFVQTSFLEACVDYSSGRSRITRSSRMATESVKKTCSMF